MKHRPVEEETEEDVKLSPEELADLDAAMEEAERGEGMDAFEFLRQLRAGTWRDPGDRTVDLVVASDADDKKYELAPEDEDALEESIAEIARGECVTAEDLLAELRAMRLRDGR
jgi:predicted transcriptional regulator